MEHPKNQVSPTGIKNKFYGTQIQEWKTFFEENGYLVIPHFAPEQAVQTLKQRIGELIENYFASEEYRKYLSVFTTGTKQQVFFRRNSLIP